MPSNVNLINHLEIRREKPILISRSTLSANKKADNLPAICKVIQRPVPTKYYSNKIAFGTFIAN